MVASGGGPSHTPVHTPWGLADQVGALNFTAQILVIERHVKIRIERMRTNHGLQHVQRKVLQHLH